MTLYDKKIIRYATDPRLIDAQKKLDVALKRVQRNIRDDAPADYYLSVLPVLLQMLAEADHELSVIKNNLYTEILNERSERDEVSGPGDGESV